MGGDLDHGRVDTATFIWDRGHIRAFLLQVQLHATLDPVKCLLLSLSPAALGISLRLKSNAESPGEVGPLMGLGRSPTRLAGGSLGPGQGLLRSRCASLLVPLAPGAVSGACLFPVS